MSNYLDLMEKVLTGMIYEDKPCDFWSGGEYKTSLREYGIDWPSQAHTMIGLKRLQQLRQACETIINENVSGQFVECGVWRGGAAIMMAAVLHDYNVTNRQVYAFDSFQGLPKPENAHDVGDAHHTYKQLSVSMKEVFENFKKYDLHSKVVFGEGWFEDTLPKAPMKQISVLRVDCDMFQSTMDVLFNLYDKVTPGGFVIIDDWQLPACRQAVQDYFGADWPMIFKDKVKQIDGMGIYWRK